MGVQWLLSSSALLFIYMHLNKGHKFSSTSLVVFKWLLKIYHLKSSKFSKVGRRVYYIHMYSLTSKKSSMPGAVAHMCHPINLRAMAGGSQAGGQPGKLGETYLKKVLKGLGEWGECGFLVCVSEALGLIPSPTNKTRITKNRVGVWLSGTAQSLEQWRGKSFVVVKSTSLLWKRTGSES